MHLLNVYQTTYMCIASLLNFTGNHMQVFQGIGAEHAGAV